MKKLALLLIIPLLATCSAQQPRPTLDITPTQPLISGLGFLFRAGSSLLGELQGRYCSASALIGYSFSIRSNRQVPWSLEYISRRGIRHVPSEGLLL